MKAFVIGPTLAEYDAGYNTGIARALVKLGFQTETFEFFTSTPPGLINRIRIDLGLYLQYRKYYDGYLESFNRRLIDRYQQVRPDLIFVVRGSKIYPATLQEMASSIRVLWCHDVVRRCDISPEQLSCYDLRYVFDASDIAWLANHFALNASFLPLGFDPEVYFPLSLPARDIDVFFVGSYYPDRRATLEYLAETFPHNTLRFYGRHVRYREPSTWSRALYYIAVGQGQTFVNEALDPGEVNRMYARSKICLNMHHTQNEAGCNPRVFEIMGAGAFQLVDAVPYVQAKLRDTLVTFQDFESLRGNISAYLSDTHLREKNIVRARQNALENHTFFHRVRDVIRDCNF